MSIFYFEFVDLSSPYSKIFYRSLTFYTLKNFDMQQLMHMLMIQQKIQQQELPDNKPKNRPTKQPQPSLGNKFNGIIDQNQQIHDPNNMTFSEAKQPNYHNLNEFQQIVSKKQPIEFQEDEGFEPVPDFQKNNLRVFNIGGNIEDQSIEGKINETLKNIRGKQGSGRTSGKVSSQVTPQSTIVSSRQPELGVKEFCQKLKSKGQIKIHKGLKRSYLVNSKQNSMPPKEGSLAGDGPTSSQRIGPSNIGANVILPKRKNMSKQTHKTIEDDSEDFFPVNQQNQIQGLNRQEQVPATQRLSNDPNHESDSLQMKLKQKIIVRNNNQVQMKSSNQILQGQTKSYKKLRKPSHQKHNSIDRTHQPVEFDAQNGAKIQEPTFNRIQGVNLQDQPSVERVKEHRKRNHRNSKIISNQKQHISQRKSPVVQAQLLQQSPVTNNLNTIAVAGGPVGPTKQNIHVTHHRHVKGLKRDKQGGSSDGNSSPIRASGQAPDPQIICNKILQNLNDNFKRQGYNTGSSGANNKGKGSSGGTNNSNSQGNKQAFEMVNQVNPSSQQNGGFIRSSGNNSFYINGPVHIINVTTSNSKSNKSSGENPTKKLSSSKSGEQPQIPSQGNNNKKSHTKTFVTNKNNHQQDFQILNDQDQIIYATQDNCNPGIIRSANRQKRIVDDEESPHFALREEVSTPPDDVMNQVSEQIQKQYMGQNLQTRSFGAAGQADSKKVSQKSSNIYKSFDFYQHSNASKYPDSARVGPNFVAGQSIQNMTREQIKQSILENQEKQLQTLKGSGGPSGGEAPSIKNGSSGDTANKGNKSQKASKNTKKGASFQLFNTEDNRSSFNKNSKKSGFSGGNANSGGLPSGNTNGLVHKTSSSNKNTRARDSVEMRVTKRSNFLDEFDQFEEQFEKYQNKKVYVNENPQALQKRNITNILSNKVSKESKESKKSNNKKTQNNNQKSLGNKKNDRSIQSKQAKNQKLVNSFIKSQSSDKIKPSWSKRDSQNQINQQYDSYMKDYANFAAVTKKLLDQKSQIEAQRDCEHCQYLEPEGLFENEGANENQIIGVYKGQEYQQIQHNQASYGVESYVTGSFAGGCIHKQPNYNKQQQNRIVSQSKIIIPRGIVNFKKGHSVSIERNNLFNQQQHTNSPSRYSNNQYNLPKPQKIIDTQNYLQNGVQQPKIIFNNNIQVSDPRPVQYQHNTSFQVNYAQSQMHSRENSLMPYKQNLLTEIDEEFQNKTPRLLNQGDYGYNSKHYNNKINTCVSQASNDPSQQMTMQSNNNNQKTFMLEPRDESLMRKKKVIQILQSFQENEESQEQPNNNKKNSKKKGKDQKATAQQYNFGEQFDFIENKLPPEPAKKKSHSNVPLSLEAFNNELQNHTYYVGKPIVIQQQNRVKKNNKNTRRRDQPPDIVKKALANEQGDPGDHSGLMSDLDDFMRYEDLKIDEQEEKFIQQTQLNQQKRQLKKELYDQFGQKRNIGSFDDEIHDSEQKVLENDLGVEFVGDSHEENPSEILQSQQQTMQNDLPQDSSDFNEIMQPGVLLNLLPQGCSNQEQNINMNLNSQIKNIDLIFEPEEEDQEPCQRDGQ